MNNLYVLEMIENENKQLKDEYIKNIISEGKIIKNKEIDIFKDEGMLLIEETIPYIENIYRNANRVIINEEEIVKIELAKKITVESVKHLSKHTNFIQNITEVGDVEPSRILNINKEESYETYENKLIYSLIQNIKIYINQKKDYLEKVLSGSKQIKDKKVEYISNTNVEGKEVSLNLSMNTILTDKGIKSKIKAEKTKIENIEKRIEILCNYELYKLFEKKHIRPVTSPIKKTNLILKNVNFQYAVRLWEYLQQNLFDSKKNIEITNNIEKGSLLDKMMSEISLLYFIAIERDDEEQKEHELNEVKKRFLNTTLELPNKEIEKVLLEKTKKDKLNNSDVEKEIRKIFDKHFHDYLNKVQK